MARIEYAMNKAQSDEVFNANAVMMSGRDVIFDYKIYELFGSEACAWAESCMHHQGYLDWGKDCNTWGDGDCNYFYKSGYEKLVSRHNYCTSLAEYKDSEGGRVWDGLWQARSERMEAAEAEGERKKEERKAKRAAARKAKHETQDNT